MMVYIPWGLSVAAILVSLYLAFHKEHRDDAAGEAKKEKDLSVQFAKMDVKQDSILNSVNEIRLDQKTQNQKIEDMQKQIIIIDQSTKSAHHRIDDLVGHLNASSERGEEHVQK